MKTVNFAPRFVDDNHVLVTKEFAKNARIFGTAEYKLWREIRQDCPNAEMVTKTIKKNPKIFGGYSDVTAMLNALNQICGMESYHMPMVGAWSDGLDEYSAPFVKAMLFGEPVEYVNPEGCPITTIVPGKAKGRLCGGNLSLLAASLGTPYEIDTKGKILFIEEIGERPYKVDGMLTNLRNGMVLVTGPAGSGKSTTLACMIDRINRSRDGHIITMEAPIEYIYAPDQCIINQREVGKDTMSFAAGLRASLREDPNVILIGEMRDRETIETAITAAETGHTVIATMHTKGAVNAIERMIDSFSGTHQAQIRFQLANVLRTVVSQQMIPDKSGNVIPAFELMHINSAIRGMIREKKDHQIENALIAGRAEGMLSMDQSILALYKAGMITDEIALSYADHPDQLVRHIGE